MSGNIFSSANHSTNLLCLWESLIDFVDFVTEDKKLKNRIIKEFIILNENYTTKRYIEKMIILFNSLIDILNQVPDCNKFKHLIYDKKKILLYYNTRKKKIQKQN